MQSLVEGLLHGLKLLSQLREEQGPAPASIDDAAGQTLTKQVLEGQLVVVLRRHRRPHVDERQQEGVQGRPIEEVPFKIGACIAQRKHSCFPPSSLGFESWLCQDFFSLLFSLWTGFRSNPSLVPCNGFHKCSDIQR